jgi:hypothetical protein
MKPLGNETPMAIRGAVTTPKSRSNVSPRNSMTSIKGSPNEKAKDIPNTISKPKTK